MSGDPHGECAHEIRRLTADLASKDAEIELLTKIASAYKTLTDSLERQRTTLRDLVDEGRTAVATLASERAANAILTADNDRLRAELAVARGALVAASQWLITDRNLFVGCQTYPDGSMEADDAIVRDGYDAVLSEIDAAIKGEA